MISGSEFVDALERSGLQFLSGVPCSYFTSPLRLLTDHSRLRYVPAANEGAALAMAAGARLAGAPSAVIAQNSGFGNLINPLTSLVLPYRIPLLVIMSMRGWPVANTREPQHRLMGRVVPDWLDSLDVPYWELATAGASISDVLRQAADALAASRTAFILVGKNVIATENGEFGKANGSSPSREDLVRALTAELRDEFVLSTTGYLSRALHQAGDRPTNFYMQGSMGHVASLALGTALTRPDRRCVVLDGDGSLLMHLGPLASIGRYAPRNLVHIVFDNRAYESTGGQPAPAEVDFAELARCAGYRHVARVTEVSELPLAVRSTLAATGPALLHVIGSVGGQPGDRASASMPVSQIATRFAASLAADR
jgi:phosphonopyruvate decarboxylase